MLTEAEKTNMYEHTSYFTIYKTKLLGSFGTRSFSVCATLILVVTETQVTELFICLQKLIQKYIFSSNILMALQQYNIHHMEILDYSQTQCIDATVLGALLHCHMIFWYRNCLEGIKFNKECPNLHRSKFNHQLRRINRSSSHHLRFFSGAFYLPI